jgi:hypothetical protein
MQLKRAQVPVKDLIQIYCAGIRATLEYASPVFHNTPPQYLSSDIERIQRRCLRRIFPQSSYEEALELANVETLRNRREAGVKNFSFNHTRIPSTNRHQMIPEENGCTNL